jgi:DNA-binding response OmpR family regulator
MNQLLIVEDERHLAEGLRFNLEAENYGVVVAETGEAAMEALERTRFDAVVLDVMLPGISGFDVVTAMRQAGNLTPTLMLTARSHPDDVLHGFEAGADDYLTKPFELAILIARIRGLLRRTAWARSGSAGEAPAHTEPPSELRDQFEFAGKHVDFRLLELRVHGEVLRLTLMEVNLLRYLIEHGGAPVSRKTMLEEVWGLHEDTDTRAIDNFVVRLRRYIEDDPSKPRHLLTVRGVGYRFVAEPAP